MYGGGGNLIPAYREGADFIETQHRRAKKLIVLPRTIDGHDELLQSLGSNVDIICREPLSYEHVQGTSLFSQRRQKDNRTHSSF